jgi:hypothetical protein
LAVAQQIQVGAQRRNVVRADADGRTSICGELVVKEPVRRIGACTRLRKQTIVQALSNDRIADVGRRPAEHLDRTSFRIRVAPPTELDDDISKQRRR